QPEFRRRGAPPELGWISVGAAATASAEAARVAPITRKSDVHRTCARTVGVDPRRYTDTDPLQVRPIRRPRHRRTAATTRRGSMAIAARWLRKPSASQRKVIQ